jgi:hypothetical protein
LHPAGRVVQPRISGAWIGRFTQLELGDRYGVKTIAPRPKSWGARVAGLVDPSGVLWRFSRGNPPLIRKVRHDTRIHDHLPALRDRQVGIDASRRLPIFLRVHRLWHQAQTQGRRLLRFLLLWLRTLSADPGRALGRGRGSFLLCKSVTVNTGARSTADWVGGARTSILARWVPKGATVAALITPVHVCCDLDRRTHLDGDSLHFKRAALRAHALPVHRPLLPRDDRAGDPAAAWSLSTFYNWLALGAVIILGAWIVWWATERTWGKFS